MTAARDIPLSDFRAAGAAGPLAFALSDLDAVRTVRAEVLAGFAPIARPLVPVLMRQGDRRGRRWLTAADDPYRAEIFEIAAALGAPGVVALNLSYEFSCTAGVYADAATGAPRLFRVLDWPYHGLGRRVRAVWFAGPAGAYLAATWPGAVGVLQAMAPDRFAAAINQAPERSPTPFRPLNFLAARRRLMRTRGLPPMHLLRRVFERARDFAEAEAMLTDTPVAAPVIFTLAGARPGEGVVLARPETEAVRRPMIAGAVAATNHYQALVEPGTRWRLRGENSESRAARAARQPPSLDAPTVNPNTRLVFEACAAVGSAALQGWEEERPATRRLSIDAALVPPAARS